MADTSYIKFPNSLSVNNHAFMKFTAWDVENNKPHKNSVPVYLYMPKYIQFNDSANYSEYDLGLIKEGAANIGFKTAEKAAQKALEMSNTIQTQSLTGSMWEASKKAVGDLLSEAYDDTAGSYINTINTMGAYQSSTMAGFAASAIWARKKGNADLEAFASYKSRMAVNPRTNMMFKGVGVRSFNFSFRLVAESASESSMITVMDQQFRTLLYPEADELRGYILFYPPVWKIEFMWKDKRNIFIPQIGNTYMTQYASAYNTTSNAFHEGGQPLDVTFNLTFTEVKANTQQDILKLN